jgi:hypothetical protein
MSAAVCAALLAVAALAGCDKYVPPPADEYTDVTERFAVYTVPMPDGRQIPCIRDTRSAGGLSCDWAAK